MYIWNIVIVLKSFKNKKGRLLYIYYNTLYIRTVCIVIARSILFYLNCIKGKCVLHRYRKVKRPIDLYFIENSGYLKNCYLEREKNVTPIKI